MGRIIVMLGFLSRKYQGAASTFSFVVGLQRLTQSSGNTDLSVFAINKLDDSDHLAIKEHRCRLPSGHILAFHGLGICPMNNPTSLILSMGNSSFKGGPGSHQAMASSHCSLCFQFVGDSFMVISEATSGPPPWLLARHEIGDDIPYCLVSSCFATYVWAWALFGLGFGHGFGWFRFYPIAIHSFRCKGMEKL